MKFLTSHGAPTTPPSSSTPPISFFWPYHKRTSRVKAEVLDPDGHLGQFSTRNPQGKSVKLLRRSGSRSWCCGGCDKVINGRLHAEHGSLFHRIPVPRWVSSSSGGRFFLIDTRCRPIIPSLGDVARLFCATATPAAKAPRQIVTDKHRDAAARV